jgi:S1-C subfamily serine protease
MLRESSGRGRRLAWLAAVVVGLVVASGAYAQRGEPLLKSSPKVLAAFREVVARPSQSTVRVLCDGKEVALGTVVAVDGWIVTKYSELLKGKLVCRLKDGRELEARVVGAHLRYDLAMLKVEARDLKPAEWRDSKEAVVGNWLVTPGTGEAPLAVGVVSVATRKPALRDMPTARPEPNSGFLGVGLEESEKGAKINTIQPKGAADKAGLKVGDVVVTVGKRKIVDSETLRNVLQRYKAGDEVTVKIKRGTEVKELKVTLGKQPERGFLGIGLEDGEKGATIGSLQPRGPAAKAGLKAGDVLVTVGEKKIGSPKALLEALQPYQPGDVVTVKVKRGAEVKELKVTLGRAPMDRGEFQNRMGSALSKHRGGFPKVLQHDTVLRPADCGGPLVDLDGKAVGINIARAGRTESYAIPSEDVQALLAELKSGRLAPEDEEEPTPAEKKLEAARRAVKQAEAELAAAQKKLEAARAELEKAAAEAKKKN